MLLIISKHIITIASSKCCSHCRVKTKVNPETQQKRKLRYPGSGFIYMTTTVTYQSKSAATASPTTDSKFCLCWNTIEVYWSIVEHRLKKKPCIFLGKQTGIVQPMAMGSSNFNLCNVGAIKKKKALCWHQFDYLSTRPLSMCEASWDQESFMFFNMLLIRGTFDGAFSL